MKVKSHFAKETINYDGSQIGSHWSLKRFKLSGDCIVSFCGGCDIPQINMIDIEDVIEESRIYSESMLHFIVEHFGAGITEAVLRQHILADITRDAVESSIGRKLRQYGTDIYDGDRKLTISVASIGPLSAKIHLGINISSRNTPVSTACLDDYGITPAELGAAIIRRYSDECEQIEYAKVKVRSISGS